MGRDEPDRSPCRVRGHSGAFGVAHLVVRDGRTAIVLRRRPTQHGLPVARRGGKAFRCGRRAAGRCLDQRRGTGALYAHRAHFEAVLLAVVQAREEIRRVELQLGPRRVVGHTRAFGVPYLVAQDVEAAVIRRCRPREVDPPGRGSGRQFLRCGRLRCRRRLDLRRRAAALPVHRAHLEAVRRAVEQAGDGVRRDEPHRGPCRVRGHSGALGVAHLVAHDGRGADCPRRRPPQDDLSIARRGGEALRHRRRESRCRLDLRRRSVPIFVHRPHLERVQRAVGQAGNATPVGKTHLGPRLIRRHAGTPGVAHLVAQDGGAAVVRRHSPAQRRPVVARHGGQIPRRGRRPAGIRLDLRRRSWRMFVRRAHLEGVQSSVGQIREVVRRRESCRGPCCVRGHSGAFGMAHLVAHDG